MVFFLSVSAKQEEGKLYMQSEALSNPLISKEVVKRLGNNPHKFLTLRS